MFVKPRFVPAFVLRFLLYHCCTDCKRWAYWRRMSDINPDVCRGCLLDRMFAGIQLEAQWRTWITAMQTTVSIARRHYELRAQAIKLRRDTAAERSKFLMSIGKFDEASEVFKEALK